MKSIPKSLGVGSLGVGSWDLIRCLPMPFRSIVGHRRVVSLLSRAVAQGSVPPSLLLAGPEGVGKRRVAMALAESLNCLQPATTEIVAPHAPSDSIPQDACGECAVC